MKSFSHNTSYIMGLSHIFEILHLGLILPAAQHVMTERPNQTSDPAALLPSEELQEDIIYSVNKLSDRWLDHSEKEF